MSEKLCASGHVISPGLERCRRCNSLAVCAQIEEKFEEKPEEKPAKKPAKGKPDRPKKDAKKEEPKAPAEEPAKEPAPAEEKDSFEKLLDEDKAKDEAEKVE